MFFTNLAVQNKQFFKGILLVGLGGRLCNSYTVYKSFFAKLVLNFNITLSLAILRIVGSRLLSNDLVFLDDISVDMQLATFYFYVILGN